MGQKGREGRAGEHSFFWGGGRLNVGNGPNMVSESTLSSTELSEFFGPHRVPGRELSEFLSAYYLCAKANSPSFLRNSPSLPQNSVSSLSPKQYSRNSIPPVSHNVHFGRFGPSWDCPDFESWVKTEVLTKECWVGGGVDHLKLTGSRKLTPARVEPRGRRQMPQQKHGSPGHIAINALHAAASAERGVPLRSSLAFRESTEIQLMGLALRLSDPATAILKMLWSW